MCLVRYRTLVDTKITKTWFQTSRAGKGKHIVNLSFHYKEIIAVMYYIQNLSEAIFEVRNKGTYFRAILKEKVAPKLDAG